MNITPSLDEPIEQLQNTLEVIQLQISKNVKIQKETEDRIMKYRYDMGLRVALKNEEAHYTRLQAKAHSYKAAIDALSRRSFE